MPDDIRAYPDGGWAIEPPDRSRGRSRRGVTRGVTALLFIFTLLIGQASFVALADDAPTGPLTTEEPSPSPDGPIDGIGDGTSEDADVLTEDGTTDDVPVGESSEPASSANEASGEIEDATVDDTGSAPSADAAADPSADVDGDVVAGDDPGPASGDGVQPTFEGGNPECLDVMAASDFLFEEKREPVVDETVELSYELDGGQVLTGTLVIEVHEDGTVDFTITGDFVAAGVIVKGGPNANVYDYRPTGNTADTGLHAPVNPESQRFYGLSHLTFCIAEVQRAPGIDVEKTCPERVQAGTEIEYTITVENTGTEALVDVSVEDSLLGDITADFDADLSSGLAVGATVTATVTLPATGDPDPVTNTVTASGTGDVSGAQDTDTATCETDVVTVEGPGIQLVKGGPSLAHRGDTVRYAFTVTNVGDVMLFDVDLTDPRCDADTIQAGVGVDDDLASAEVWTFTCTHLVTQTDPDPLTNTATIRADTVPGVGGEEVTDTDTHALDVVQPAIRIVKTVSDDTVPVGTVVTYTYVVTNLGDTTLFDVSVDDDVIGPIDVIPSLAPGASVTLTADFSVGTSPVTNIGTAGGSDVLGGFVSDTDSAFVSSIAGGGLGGPGPGVEGTGGSGGSAFTGWDAWGWILLAAGLAVAGALALIATRSRRTV
ncbi:MAG TPA: CARDB domain-containing protein [Actinomycetota bacterium]|nr:CARDB domain-containing protein [Actinomycetota bacterium]